MFSSNKILSIIFILLFLVLIGEVVYFMTTSNQPSLSTKPIPSIAPTPPKRNDDDFLLETGFVDYVSNLKKVEGKKIYWREVYEGLISDISLIPYTTQGKEFLGFFVMSNEKGELIQRFSFTENRIKGWKFYKISKNGEKTLIKYTDLKKEQKITYSVDIDVAKRKAINDSDIINDEFVVQE